MRNDPQPEFKGAIFDLDGVIVDTVPLHFNAWKRMFATYGKPFTFDDYKNKVDGIPRVFGAKAILTDLSDKEVNVACDKKQVYFLESLEEGDVPAYDSTIRLIRDLKAQEKLVATASSSKNCQRILQRIGVTELMDAVVGGAELSRPKPDPQIFQLAAGRLGCEPSTCVVFEDAVLGVQAAVRGDFRCVGVDRYGQPERLSEADIVVADLSEIDYRGLEGLFNR